MKNIIGPISIFYCLLASLNIQAQQTENFDGASFTLPPNSFYKSTTSASWQTSAPVPFATFRYQWDTAYGGLWMSGAAYTNIKDSVNSTFTNLYGCITNDAFNGDNYVTVQRKAIIKMNSHDLSLTGFFVTNSTYAYKTMKNGNTISRKFGDTTGTFSGLAQGTYPDWFKLIVHPYRNGVLLTDSVEHYLADYRPAGTADDILLKSWEYVNCSSLPLSDSVLITLRSSDNGTYGMNTPGFFCLDNITIVNTVGLQELDLIQSSSLYPNPAKDYLYIQYTSSVETPLLMSVYDIYGKELFKKEYQAAIGTNQLLINTAEYASGVYVIELKNNSSSKKMKVLIQ